MNVIIHSVLASQVGVKKRTETLPLEVAFRLSQSLRLIVIFPLKLNKD
jgi:hypothetical protein